MDGAVSHAFIVHGRPERCCGEHVGRSATLAAVEPLRAIYGDGEVAIVSLRQFVIANGHKFADLLK
jgi:hypothetical protein